MLCSPIQLTTTLKISNKMPALFSHKKKSRVKKVSLKGKSKMRKILEFTYLKSHRNQSSVVISIVKKHCINNEMVFVLFLTHNFFTK